MPSWWRRAGATPTCGGTRIDGDDLNTGVSDDRVSDLVEKAVRTLEPGLC